jgi:chromosome partitioning protein
MKTTTICFANNKGGSGKSTTCSNVGYSLAQSGKRVLLIDGDMQLNLSLSIFDEDTVLEIAKSDKNLYSAIREQKDLSDFIYETPYKNLDIIPSSTLMSGIEYELFTKWQRELILKKCLKAVKESEKYDYILIDAPPTLGGWAMNLLCASDYLLIPVEASPWGLFGLANMFEFYSAVTDIQPDLQILGIAVTKVNERKNYFKQTFQSLKEMEDFYIFDSYVRIDSTVEWAQDAGKPVAAFKKSSRAAEEYEALAKEINKQVQKRNKK